MHTCDIVRFTPFNEINIHALSRLYSPFIIHTTVRHAEPVNDHYGNATGHYGDPSACACSVYQALSPSPLEEPGNEARLGAAVSTMVLQQWCAITLSPGILSLHTQQSVHFRPFSIAKDGGGPW